MQLSPIVPAPGGSNVSFPKDFGRKLFEWRTTVSITK
jgi:hypothetical protein